MSTALYRAAQVKLNDGTWTWTSLPVAAALLTANYTLNRVDHESMADVPSDAVIVRDIELVRLRSTGALAKGVIPSFDSFLDTREVFALLLYTLADADADSKLIYYSSDGIGFPFTPAGFDYSVAYRQEYGGFFQL